MRYRVRYPAQPPPPPHLSHSPPQAAQARAVTLPASLIPLRSSNKVDKAVSDPVIDSVVPSMQRASLIKPDIEQRASAQFALVHLGILFMLPVLRSESHDCTSTNAHHEAPVKWPQKYRGMKVKLGKGDEKAIYIFCSKRSPNNHFRYCASVLNHCKWEANRHTDCVILYMILWHRMHVNWYFASC